MKASKYLIEFKHDEYWPFYHVEHRYGRVILTINTAHPFFEHLYEPLRKLGSVQAEAMEDDGVDAPAVEDQDGPWWRWSCCCCRLAAPRPRSRRERGRRKNLETLRREWSGPIACS